ncbi:MAG TPA: ABC transporter substrate-binding protein [bacterium]|nr:ABC transporter substrate-binding protein [bacterium]
MENCSARRHLHFCTNGVKAVALALGLALALAVSTTAAAPSGDYNLSVLETTPGFFDLPLYVVMHDGYATANHLILTLAQFQTGGGTTSQVFAGGTGDIMMGGMDLPVRLAQTKTLDVTVLADMLQRGVFVLVSKAGSPYHTLQSLKGQIVGISGPGAFSEFALHVALKKNGMDPNDVQIAALGGTPAQYAAVLSGKATAVQLQSPILENALAQHTVQPIYDFRTEQGLQAGLVFTGRTAAVRANPAPYIAFMRAYRQALQKIRTDPVYAMKWATEEWGSTTPAANLQIQLDSYLRNPGIWSLDGVFTVVMYNNTRELLLGSGLFTEPGFPTYKQLTQYAPPLQ